MFRRNIISLGRGLSGKLLAQQQAEENNEINSPSPPLPTDGTAEEEKALKKIRKIKKMFKINLNTLHFCTCAFLYSKHVCSAL